MTGPFLLNVIGVVGWLLVAVFAYAFVTLFGFFGIGFYGLLLLFICMQVELGSDGDGHASGAAARIQRALFKAIGVVLTVVGFGGFYYFQLD